MVRAVGTPSWSAIRNKPAFSTGGTKVALYGDSIMNFNNRVTYSAGTLSTLKDEAEGFMSWLQFMSKFAFDYNLDVDAVDFSSSDFDTALGGNFGVGGDTSAEALARINDVLSYNPDICFVRLGTNDLVNTAMTFSEITANYESIISQLTGAGILVVWITIPPRSSWGDLTAGEIIERRNLQNRLNDWIVTYRNRTSSSLFLSVDTRPLLIDPTSATGDPESGILRDGVHMAPLAGYREAKEIWRVLQAFVPPSTRRLAFSAADTYDATNNPQGNLLTNGMLLGTTGTKGTDVSGDVADGMYVSRSGGSGTINSVCSKGATGLDGNAGTYQRFVVTAVGTGDADDSITMKQTTDITTGFAAGDVIEAGCLASMTSVTGKLREFSLSLEVTDSAAGTYSIEFLDQYDQSYLFPNVDISGMFKTQKFKLPSTATAINLRAVMRFDNTSAGGGTFDVGNMFIRKVA